MINSQSHGPGSYGAAGWKQGHGQAAFPKLMGLKQVLGSHNTANFTTTSWHSTAASQFVFYSRKELEIVRGSHQGRDVLGAKQI